MKYYLAGDQLVATQAEAKASGKPFALHDVPTDKDGLMAYVNKLRAENAELKSGYRGGVPVGDEPPPAPAPPAAPAIDIAAIKRQLVEQAKSLQGDAVEAKILAAAAPQLGRFLSAAICRLGELGRPAFEAFQSQRNWGGDPDAEVGKGANKRWHLTASDERGLRYLALSLIDDLKGAWNEQGRSDGEV